MARDTVIMNGGGVDQTMVDPVDLLSTSSATLTFAASAPAGATLATLRTERSAVGGGAVFVTFGTVPPQLALVGNRIVKGAGAAVAGTVYAICIRAEASDGIHGSNGGPVRFRAT